MTIEELRDFAKDTLDDAIAEIRESGSVSQKFFLVKRDGGMEIIFVKGAVTNDENAKRALSRAIKARVAAGGIEAVIMVSDTYWAEMPKAADTMRQRFGMTVKQAADAGMCVAHEGVMAILESPILALLARQEYRRDGTRIELVGAPVIADDASAELKIRMRTSRFTNFFPRSQSGATS